MPPSPILDPTTLDPSKLIYTHEQIYQYLPQRHEFEQLDGILHLDPVTHTAAGVRNVKPDEWWCRGHMPGSPLFPGVLMLECAAQLAAFVQIMVFPMPGAFMAFGGIDGAKFRGSVAPPAQIILLLKEVEARPRRYVCDIQAFCNDPDQKGKGLLMVFEGRITGLPWVKDA